MQQRRDETSDDPPFRFGLQSFNAASSPQALARPGTPRRGLGSARSAWPTTCIGPGPALTRDEPSGAGRRRGPGDGRRHRGDQHDQHRLPGVLHRLPPTGDVREGAGHPRLLLRGPPRDRHRRRLAAGRVRGDGRAVGPPPASASTGSRRRSHCSARTSPTASVDVHGDPRQRQRLRGLSQAVPSGLPPIMIGGGAERVLGIAGREADIVSLNFDNSSGKIGAGRRRQQHGRAHRAEDRVDPRRRRRPFRRPRARDRGVLHRRHRRARCDAGEDGADVRSRARAVRRAPSRADRLGRRDLRHARRAARDLRHLVRHLRRVGRCRRRRADRRAPRRTPDHPTRTIASHGQRKDHT